MGARRVSGSLSFVFLLLIAGHATAETAVAPSPVATAASSSTAITTTSTGPPTTTTSRAVARRCGKRHRRRCRRGRGRCPIAKAGPDQFTQTMTPVRFDGGASFDPRDTIIAYAWTFGDGGSASGSVVSHAYATPGTYCVILRVTDSRGMRASDTALVSVVNRSLVAKAGPDHTASMGSAVTFSGSSSDLGGTVVSYSWDFGDGTSATGAAVGHIYTAPGSYTATLTVMDDRGARGTDSALVTITGAAGAGWARGFGGAASDVAYGVALDGSGNAVMTGRIEGSVDFGGGVVCPPTAVFVSTYAPTGAALWSKCLGGVLGGGTGRAVAVDRNGNVLVTGKFSGTVDFGTGPLTSAGGDDVFLAKYTAAGDPVWSKAFGGAMSDVGNGVAVDSGGGVDIFLATLSPTGGHVWSRRFGSALATHAGNGVACDGSGNVLVTGSFESSIDLGGGWARSFAHKDVFVAKYSPAGAYLWSRLAGGIYDDAGRGIAVDASGQVAVTGIFQAAVNFGTGSLISAGRTDIFVARYAADGTPLGAQRFGGAASDAGNAVAADGSGRSVVTGGYRLRVDFDGTPLAGAGMDDIFLLASW